MPSIWKGSITFGLVNVPVELRAAVREHRLSFRMLHGEDNSPIRFERVRADNGKPVPWKEIVKGYPAPGGDFVILTDEDFAEAAVERSTSYEILDFVRSDSIDPRFYESSYFMTPAKGGDRAYALLRDAMEETDTVGIGKIILHRKQHLAAIRVLGEAIELVIMRFASELVDPADYSFPPKSEAKAPELRLAVQLVDNLQSEFQPEKYTDEYNENLLRIINAKAKGQRISLTAPERATAEPRVLDLMDKLRESLAQGKKQAPAQSEEPTERRGRVSRKTAGAARTSRKKKSA